MSETNVDTKTLPALLGKPLVIEVQGVPATALPPGWNVSLHHELLPAPQRTKRAVGAHEVGGFTSYVNRFKTAATALYCTSDEKPSLLARLDDHQLLAPSHVEHTVSFPCPHTEEWKRWLGFHQKRFSQQEFAEFIEDNLRDVVQPTGVEFLSAVTNFSDVRKVEFRSATRLGDGKVSFQYSDKDAMVEVLFPQEITIAIPVFAGHVGEDSKPVRYSIKARVKYRLNGPELSMWIELDRPDLVRKVAYADLIEKVELDTDLHVHRAI